MKKTEKQAWLYGGIGLLAGLVIAGSVANATAHNDHRSFMKKMDMHMGSSQGAKNHRDMSMAEMSTQLRDKSGDEFDKAFTEMMIAHHEGAIEMAELIPSRAKHDEIKKLGEAIISAQTKEISEMKQWQNDWGYSGSEMDSMMHGR
jgi:uncharacterized protein (DUF305 family)